MEPNTILFKLWKDIPVPFYLSVYLFEVQNWREVLRGAKPELAQRGPYVYRYALEFPHVKQQIKKKWHATWSVVQAPSTPRRSEFHYLPTFQFENK